GGDHRVVAHQRRRVVKTAGADDGAVIAVEAALQRPVVLGAARLVVPGDVPLADRVGAIPGRLKGFGDGNAIAVQVAAVTVETLVLHHVADAGLVWIKAGEQTGAGRAAAGGVVELREAQAAGGEGVEVGRRDLAAVAAEVGVAHVVGQDYYD